MNSKLNELESIKLFKEFNYLKTDVEFKNEFQRVYGGLFDKELRKALREEPGLKERCIKKFGKLLESEEKQNNSTSEGGPTKPKQPAKLSESREIIISDKKTEEKEDIILIKSTDTKKLKELYKKISKKTHPDKIKSDSLSSLYIKAKEARENRDIFTLYSICREIGIDYNISSEEIKHFKKIISNIKKQVQIYELGYIWAWGNANDDKIRRNLAIKFLENHAPQVKVLFK